ncbi:PREDICTED: auxin response factor 19-like isoform X2 [Tarenaya hassleriana]|uniref:auxin response factor 19-like isoform X2 n=1 Tax=Tarenaya hassleriana TaxID=28532 RepID=UPI0008FD78D2|nr:PREDICTED: auxin response factor 19-like isoform X2 [Tarenaya hassleriana]
MEVSLFHGVQLKRFSQLWISLLHHLLKNSRQEIYMTMYGPSVINTASIYAHFGSGQPKRHLLTTGWSLFVSGKRLLAGDSVLFIRDEKQQLLVGIRHANRQSANLSSSVLSTDSMHIGILAAAAHAAANNSPFTIFYNPRTSPSEFVIPLAKYYRAVHGNQISPGMRFRMMFETEESGTRRYMGTVTGISDLDPLRWKNSQWRNLQVGWDESTAGEKRNRVSIWEIESVTAPFFISPPPYFRSKRLREPGLPDIDLSDMDRLFKRVMPWLGDDFLSRDSQALRGLSLVQWMNLQQNPSLAHSLQSNYLHSLSGSILPNLPGSDLSRLQFGFSPPQITQQSNADFNPQRLPQQVQQVGQLSKISSSSNPLGSILQPQPQQLDDVTQQSRQNNMSQSLLTSQVQNQVLQTQNIMQGNNVLQQQRPSLQQQQNSVQTQNIMQGNMGSNQQQNSMQFQIPDQVNQHLLMPDNQIQQLQLLQKLQQQQQQALLGQQTMLPHHRTQLALLQDQQRQMLDGSEMPQSNIISQQIAKGGNHDARFSHLPQQPKLENRQTVTSSELPGRVGLSPFFSTNQLSVSGASGLTGMANDIPSCSNSPSAINNPTGIQLMVNKQSNMSASSMGDDMVHSVSMLLHPKTRETVASGKSYVKQKESWPKCDVRPSVDISKCQSEGLLPPHSYMSGTFAQTEHFDASSSTTSVCISQNNNVFSSNPHPTMVRDSVQEREIQTEIQGTVLYGADIDGQMGMLVDSNSPFIRGITAESRKDFSSTLTPGCMIENYDNSKDAQQEDLSSSLVSQSFSVPDMTFNSIDSNNDGGFANRGPWPSQPQFQRKRTYTKVYKRGAVGRSIDITSYSGYDELKQDLGRRFGIEGQLENRGGIGWKLVYVDHENDALLVGDDPWEEFVNCVRCIRILSPQEELYCDFDFGSCVTSDNGA